MSALRVAVLAPVLAGFLFAGCGSSEAPAPTNILLLIAADLGLDHLAAYEFAQDPPSTPHIDALAARGVLFRNAYAPSVCSPARAALLTGRHPLRYGFGTLLEAQNDPWELPLDEFTLPEALALANPPYANAAVGKRHMSTRESPHAFGHPQAAGFSSHAGSLANLGAGGERGERGSYYAWEKLRDGTASHSTTYATTDTANDAIERIGELSAPWFLWVAFNAPHRPLHAPPPEFTSRALDTPLDHFRASIEAMDAEIGRVLASVSENTTVIFLSDNGTPGDFVQPPFESGQSKGTLAESGVRVPLLIAGPDVRAPGTSSTALVQLVDVFASIVELAGLDPHSLRDAEGRDVRIDGVSLVPLLHDPAAAGAREFVFQGLWWPNGRATRRGEQWLLRDATHKLTRRCGAGRCAEQLYRFRDSLEGERVDPAADPVDAAARLRLNTELDRILSGS